MKQRRKSSKTKLRTQMPHGIIFVCLLFIILGSGIWLVQNRSKNTSSTPSGNKDSFVHDVYHKELAKLQDPFKSFGIKTEYPGTPYCREVIVAVNKNGPNEKGTRCSLNQGGYVYLRSDENRSQVRTAASAIDDLLQANGWRPQGGHADIKFLLHYLLDNEEILVGSEQTDSPILRGNTLNKSIDARTACEFTEFVTADPGMPIGIRINMSCDYDEPRAN